MIKWWRNALISVINKTMHDVLWIVSIVKWTLGSLNVKLINSWKLKHSMYGGCILHYSSRYKRFTIEDFYFCSMNHNFKFSYVSDSPNIISHLMVWSAIFVNVGPIYLRWLIEFIFNWFCFVRKCWSCRHGRRRNTVLNSAIGCLYICRKSRTAHAQLKFL